ncbi:MAG TPA: D-alanyl-D-alanine carboxypeptidase family protein [Egibacteraceae bacterium]|nr:D-alanyl-D-alanine carboxypeptidase family protein [Egibacteraceae bacterium]
MGGVARWLVAVAAVLLALAAAGAPAWAQPPRVTAAGAVLWDPADQRVLYGRDETVSRPMASTTKIMTTLVALEAGAGDDELVVSPGAAAQQGASLGLAAGQRIPARSVLAGLMLRSGNDASQAIAEHVAGSEAAFVGRMNARAAELGLTGTQFLNASGLTDDPGHRATPLDLARLAEVAMAHPDIAAWAGAASLTVPGLPPMTNRNELIGTYPGATGVKTGFTNLSRYSLVGSATRDGRTFYAVVLRSEDSFGDTARLLDHGFGDFRRAEPVQAGAPVTVYRWADAAVTLLADDALGRTVPADGPAVTWRTVVPPVVDRPVAAGSVLGEAQLLIDGAVERSVPLRAATGVGEVPEAPAAVRAGAAVQEALRTFARLHEIDRAA